jgi:hypothetical protein
VGPLSLRTASAAVVTGARIVGTTAEIVARTDGIDVEVAHALRFTDRVRPVALASSTTS